MKNKEGKKKEEEKEIKREMMESEGEDNPSPTKTGVSDLVEDLAVTKDLFGEEDVVVVDEDEEEGLLGQGEDINNHDQSIKKTGSMDTHVDGDVDGVGDEDEDEGDGEDQGKDDVLGDASSTTNQETLRGNTLGEEPQEEIQMDSTCNMDPPPTPGGATAPTDTEDDMDATSVSTIGGWCSSVSTTSTTSSRKPRGQRPRPRNKKNKKQKDVPPTPPRSQRGNNSTSQDATGPAKCTLSMVCEALSRRRAEAGIRGIFKPGERGVVRHNHGPTSRDQVIDEANLSLPPPDTIYQKPISLSTISDAFCQELKGKKTQGGGVIPFVMLTRVIQRDGPGVWDSPSPALFDALVSQIDLETSVDQSLNLVLSWANMSQGAALLGLNSRNFALLQHYRGHISDSILGECEFITVPRMAIDNSSAEVSTMLRGELRGVMTERLPALLFLRNPGLRGKVEVTSTKVFTDKDKTKKGQSMAGWRLMELTGDSTFYESLAGYEEDYQFQHHGKLILIKGGTRKPGYS